MQPPVRDWELGECIRPCFHCHFSLSSVQPTLNVSIHESFHLSVLSCVHPFVNLLMLPVVRPSIQLSSHLSVLSFFRALFFSCLIYVSSFLPGQISVVYFIIIFLPVVAGRLCFCLCPWFLSVVCMCLWFLLVVSVCVSGSLQLSLSLFLSNRQLMRLPLSFA